MPIPHRMMQAGTLLLAGALQTVQAGTPAPVAMPPITGERTEVTIPTGWRLAYAESGDNGSYLLEYLPAGETIDHWRGEYLLVGRYPYPAGSGKTDLKQPGAASIGDGAVAAIQKQAAATCRGQGRFTAMSHHWNVFNGFRFSVSGGFCTQMGTAAPFGEGAVIAFIEGNRYLHQVSFHWRPASAAQRAEREPYWWAEDGAVIRYLTTIKATQLCDGPDEPACSPLPGSPPPANR